MTAREVCSRFFMTDLHAGCLGSTFRREARSLVIEIGDGTDLYALSGCSNSEKIARMDEYSKYKRPVFGTRPPIVFSS